MNGISTFAVIPFGFPPYLPKFLPPPPPEPTGLSPFAICLGLLVAAIVIGFILSIFSKSNFDANDDGRPGGWPGDFN